MFSNTTRLQTTNEATHAANQAPAWRRARRKNASATAGVSTGRKSSAQLAPPAATNGSSSHISPGGNTLELTPASKSRT